MTKRLVDRWRQLGIREQLLLGIPLMVAVAYGVVEIAVRPLVDARQEARADIARYDAALDRLSSAPDIAGAPDIPDLPVATVLTETAPSFGLAIRRLETAGEGAQVVLQNADFTALILWIDELESDRSIGVVTAQLDRNAEPGMVTARLLFSR